MRHPHRVRNHVKKGRFRSLAFSLSLSISLTLFLWHCLKMIYLLKSYSLNMNLSETIPPPPPLAIHAHQILIRQEDNCRLTRCNSDETPTFHKQPNSRLCARVAYIPTSDFVVRFNAN